MNITDLICGEKFDALPRTFKPLGQIFAGFLFGIRLQLDDVEALFLGIELVQCGDQRRLAEQEHMGTTFRSAGRQGQQGLEGGLVELLGIIHQQIDFLTGQGQLHYLGEDRADFSLGHVQRLGHLAQHAGSVAGAAGRHHHALHRLLVGTGYQRLAQQGLAAALRPGDHQQQLAVAGQVMQLPQHGLALGRKELEARDPGSERIVAQLVMAEESLVGVQTSHRDLINL